MLRRRKRELEDDAPLVDDRPAQSDEPVLQGDRLTPVEIQQKVFRLAFRGYNERDVDEFLDRVTEEIATLHEENKRLREAVQDAGGAPAALGGAQQQAEDVVRQAREHAARLVEEAERRAASIGVAASVDAGPATIPSTFLSRERNFLKSLAAMVQDHARALKEEVREARSAAAGPEAAGDEAADLQKPERATAGAAAAAPVVPPPAAEIERPELAQPAEPTGAEAAPAEGAPWGPARAEPEAGTPFSWREETRKGSREFDPLVSAWESAFGPMGEEPKPADQTPEDADQTPKPAQRKPEDAEKNADQKPEAAAKKEEGSERSPERRPPEKEEPSLKELFWGEQ